MKKIEFEELKQVQLDILGIFHEYCEKNGLQYSLACGTLIGAIRHQGYIPWDDDIDVYMKRDDYDKLVSSFPNEYLSNYELISLERDKNWCRAYANLYDKRTIKIEGKTSEEKQIGINIDIFPVDRVPDNFFYWHMYDFLRRLLVYINTAKYVTPGNRSIIKKATIIIIKIVLFPISAHSLAVAVNNYAQLFRKKAYKKLFECTCGIIQKRPFNIEDFSETILHRFESRNFMIMKGYDDYLRNGFGDYMKLPPENKRISHHTSLFYWK